MVGGLLLHTTRHTVVRSCNQRFSKFVTSCTEQQTVYDAETGEEVVQVDVVEGLTPYGVDAVFLPTSTEYNAALAVGECISLCNWQVILQDWQRLLAALQSGNAAMLPTHHSWQVTA